MGDPQVVSGGPVEAILKVTLRVFLVLAVGAVVALYVASDRTHDAFAWTIEPPLTAAMLGAAYTGSLTLFGMTAFATDWARVRCAVPAPFVLSTAMLATTLLHVDRFHLTRGGIPGVVAWIWLVVYILVPPLLGFAWFRHRGRSVPRLGPALPYWAAGLSWAAAVAFLVLGVLLLLAPTAGLASAWPWTLTPLTARAMGSWLLAAATSQAHISLDRDLVRIRPLLAAVTATGLFGLGALVRFAGSMTSSGRAVVATALTLLLIGGGAGLAASLRPRRRAAPIAA